MAVQSRIIFLHGASSSGKSTLARKLQQNAEVPLIHLSIDHVRDSGSLPMQRFQAGDFDWAACRAAVFGGFHQSIAAYANAGNNLIVEHILDTPGWIDTLKLSLKQHDVLFVAVHCPLDVLNERERARGDRVLGSAERDQKTIHIDRLYDLEIDGSDSADINTRKVLDVWRSGLRCSEFC